MAVGVDIGIVDATEAQNVHITLRSLYLAKRYGGATH